TVSASCARSRASLAYSRRLAITAGSATSRSSSSYRRSTSASRSSMARHASRRREGPHTPSAGGGGCSAALFPGLVAALGGLAAVFAVEALHPARGVDQLLLAGEEGMACRADLDVDALLRGAGLDDIAAGADDAALLVARMNAFLHGEAKLLTGAPGRRNAGGRGTAQARLLRTRRTASCQSR